MKNNYIILFLLFLSNLIFRVYRIDLLPLYPDESGGHFYNYWWLENHNIFQNPINHIIYRLTSFTWLMGLNEMGVRLPSVLFSSLMPIIYFWSILPIKSFIKDKKTLFLNSALFSAILISIAPWSFMIGRLGHTNSVLMIIFFLLSIGLLLRKKIILGLFNLVLSLYFYPSVILLTIPILIWIYYFLIESKKINKRTYIYFCIFASIVFSLFLVKYNGLNTQGRALDLSIWRDVNLTAESNFQRGISRESNPSVFSSFMNTEFFINKVFLNRITSLINEFGQRYFSFWDIDWLFISGDPILRHSTGMNGQFYWWMAPFMLVGLVILLTKIPLNQSSLMLLVIFLTPISASLTTDGSGYLLRVLTMLPFLTYLVSLGIVGIVTKISSKINLITTVGLIFLIFLSSWNFLFKYFHVYPKISSSSYEDGWKELALWQKDHQDKPTIVIWQGYYAKETFRFWQNNMDNYQANDVYLISINAVNLFQVETKLYFFWPSQLTDAEHLSNLLEDFYIVFPSNYLNNNPQYRKLLKNKITTINGKYSPNVWEIWENQTNWLSQNPQ